MQALEEYLVRENILYLSDDRANSRFRGMVDFFALVGTVFASAAKGPPSTGYEPLLNRHGWNPVVARMAAKLLVRHGNRVAADTRRQTKVAGALRVLANSESKLLARRRSAVTLLSAWNETTIVETIFDAAGLDVFEFIRLLERTSEGDGNTKDRLAHLAAAVLPVKRGRKVSAASAAHEFLLENVAPIVHGQSGYTWNDAIEEFTDSLTVATRREFKQASFDPRPARRRLRARQGASRSNQQDHFRSGFEPTN